jgi:hypothetical protein
MEKFIYNCLFFLSILFLYVIFSTDVVVITLLSLIYIKIGDYDE